MKHLTPAEWAYLEVDGKTNRLHAKVVAEIRDLIDEAARLEARTARLEAELRSAEQTIKELRHFKDLTVE